MLGKQSPHTLNIFQLYLVSFVGWFYFSSNCALACPMMFWNCKGLCSWINLQICFYVCGHTRSITDTFRFCSPFCVWDNVFHWNFDSPSCSTSWDVEVLLFSPYSTGVQSHTMCLAFYMSAGNLAQTFMHLCQSLYILSHLLIFFHILFYSFVTSLKILKL